MEIQTANFGDAEITYRVIDDPESKETIVCCGGLGGTHLIWSKIVRFLRDRYRIVIWDYPGLRAGATLSKDVPVDVPSLTDYLSEVMNASGTSKAHLIGWSLGVQVAVEFARLRCDRIHTMTALCGLAGVPFIDDAEGDPLRFMLRGKSLPEALEWLSGRLDSIDRLRRILQNIEGPTRWAKRFGLVDPNMDEIVFDAVVRDFLAIPTNTFNRYARASVNHNATDLLETLPVPLLAIAGEKDRFIRTDRVREMVKAIPSGEFFEVRGGTHYLPLEYGELVSLKFDDFAKRQ